MSEDTIVMIMLFSIFGLAIACCAAFIVVACLLANAGSWKPLPVDERPMSVWTWIFSSIGVGIFWAITALASMGFGLDHGGGSVNITFAYFALYSGPVLYVVGSILYGMNLRKRAIESAHQTAALTSA